MEKLSRKKTVAFVLAVAVALGLVTWGFAALRSGMGETRVIFPWKQGSMQTFGGLGLEIAKEDGNVIVVRTLDGMPAEKAGVKAGDRIVRVNDETLENPDINDVVSKLRGEPGTEVTITVARGEETKTFTITRGEVKVSVPTVRIIERKLPRDVTPTPGEKKCPQCGWTGDGEARFCPRCGARLDRGRMWEPDEFWPFGRDWPWVRRGDEKELEEYQEALRKLEEARRKLWRSVPSPRLWGPDFPDERLFEFPEPKGPREVKEFRMDMDVQETDDAITIKCDVPGMKKEDIEIRLKGNLLTIKGKRSFEEETKDEKGQIVRKERRFGSFSRSFTLPGRVEKEAIKTSYEDGVLTIVVPKEKGKPEEEKEIKIDVGTS